jgi:DNA-binding transcriptional MerR regulator
MPTDLTLAEISALADVPVRTIRYYLAQGLIPGPGREGPGTRYPVAVLHRLRLIRQLQREHLPLAEIRKRLVPLTDEEVEALAVDAPAAPPADDALEYIRRVLGGPAAIASGPRPAGPRAPDTEPGLTRPSPGLLRAAIEPSLAQPIEPSPVEPVEPSPSAAPTQPAPAPLERSQWERIVLEPDVELHVRRPSSRIANKRVERLVAFARELLEEDHP